jgi:hypothetical protein
MEDGRASKSIRLPSFDGEANKFQVWWMRFTAYAGVYRFAQALKESGDSNLPEAEELEDEDEEDTEARQNAVKRNAIAMANLTMAFETEALMGMIHKSITDEWPSGLAWKGMIKAPLRQVRW